MNQDDLTRGLPASLAELFRPDLQERLVSLRRDLHRNPELSGEERASSVRLRRELERLDPASLEDVAGTGLLARIRGRDPEAPTVAIRGDIDALPIEEGSGLEYASRRSGVMHACGHDLHAAWAVGAACLLAEKPAAGDVLVLLQPAEETCQGAAAVLESGLLDGVETIFAAHVDTRFEVGCVLVEEGPVMASADTFQVRLTGKGGHGGRPHETKDPIVGAASLVMTLQTVVAREVDPARAAVLSVTRLEAGRTTNVIPEEALLSGTMRALDPETRRSVHDALRRVVEGVSHAGGLACEISIELGPPPLENPPDATALACRAAGCVVGPERVLAGAGPLMAGEDFAFYLEKLSGCYLRVGARAPGTRPVSTHSSDFVADERAILVGAAVLAECARLASEGPTR